MTTAYEQLRDVVARHAHQPLWQPEESVAEDPGSARPAAVLILFGVLDAVPSDHEAKHRAVSRDLDVLLLTRADTLRSHPGQVAFPGGRIDDEDDGPVDAALREAWEETGLNRSGVEVLGPLREIAMPFAEHRVTPVIGWWRAPTPVGVVDVAESQAVYRAPVADLVNPGNRVSWRIDHDGVTRRGPAWELTINGERQFIWGFTAGILDRLLASLGWDEPWDTSREVALTP